MMLQKFMFEMVIEFIHAGCFEGFCFLGMVMFIKMDLHILRVILY
jgi:hypothetical protein